MLVLLSLHRFTVGDATLTPAIVVFVLATAWYLTRGQPALGLAVSLVNALLLVLAQALANSTWLAGGLGWGVVLEALAMVGLFRGLIAEIEVHARPTHIRNLAHPVT